MLILANNVPEPSCCTMLTASSIVAYSEGKSPLVKCNAIVYAAWSQVELTGACNHSPLKGPRYSLSSDFFTEFIVYYIGVLLSGSQVSRDTLASQSMVSK